MFVFTWEITFNQSDYTVTPVDERQSYWMKVTVVDPMN